MTRRYQSAADYAAVGVAPLLIFVMLASLASFLNLLVYHGPYAQRVPMVLLFYTMGTVALARVTIENSRSYSMVYAIGLGAAAFVVMLQYFGNPIFSAFILALIGYLADRVTHDCTIIDDGVDSSGRGLIDSIAAATVKPVVAPEPGTPQARGGHQPGRTVLYLAAGALPLFGIGQFFLSDHPQSWPQARWLLTAYLFSALSLLVVTSFLNLRRYLRQRQTEMPTDVTLAWIAGGMTLIVLILTAAYWVPLPGQAIASFRVPDFLENASPFTASDNGWGDEGAENVPEGMQRKDSPNGTNAGSSPDESDPSPTQPNSDSGPKVEGQKGGGGENDSKDGQPSQGGQGDETSDESKDPPKSQENGSGKSEDSGEPQGEKPNNPKPGDASQSADEPSPTDDAPPNPSESPTPTTNDESSDSQRTSEASPKANADAPPASPPTPAAPSLDWSGIIGGLFKWLIFAALIALVAYQLLKNWNALVQWWESLWASPPVEPTMSVARDTEERGPTARRFATFRNPIGSTDDTTAIVVTFQALDAWCRERGIERGRDETPSEFIQRAGREFPTLRQSGLRVVDAYNRIVYGGGRASAPDVDAAAHVWQTFAKT